MKSNPKENIPQLIDYLFKAYGQKVAEKVLWEYVDNLTLPEKEKIIRMAQAINRDTKKEP